MRQPSSRPSRCCTNSASCHSESNSRGGSETPSTRYGDGADQSVHSRATAHVPRSAWRTMSVSTPETRRVFRTSKRWPRKGWKGWTTSAHPKGGLSVCAVRDDRRDTQRSLLAVGFRNVDPLCRQGLIGPRQQVPANALQVSREISLHSLLIHAVHTRGASTSRCQRHSSCLLQPRPIGNQSQQTVEPAGLIRRRPRRQLALHFADYQRSSPLSGQLIRQTSHLNCSPSPCSGLSPPRTTTGTPPACLSSGSHSLGIQTDLPQFTCRTQTYW